MQDWTKVVDSDFDFSFRYPHETPKKREAAVLKSAQDGIHRVHVSSADESELYFEITAYDDRLNHQQAAERQKANLLSRTADGSARDNFKVELDAIQGTAFNFEGMLEGKFKVRRFLFADSGGRTYRFVYDPTSSLNEEVLKTVQLGTQAA